MADPTREMPPPPDVPAPHDLEVSEQPTVRVEEPRRHPMAYLALAVGTLALILSIAALARDDGPERIRVGNNDCVVVAGDGDAPDALFCNTATVPSP